MSVTMLPPKVSALVELLGATAASRLLIWRGGDTLLVPRPASLNTQHDLVQRIGAEAAFKLAHRYGGEELNLPRCDGILDSIKAEKMVAMWRQDVSIRKIARDFGVTERTVFRIIAKGRVVA